jgi:hypothetical protein
MPTAFLAEIILLVGNKVEMFPSILSAVAVFVLMTPRT